MLNGILLGFTIGWIAHIIIEWLMPVYPHKSR